MLIQKYTIKVYTDFTHGFHTDIEEIYAPELNLFINKKESRIGDKYTEHRLKNTKNQEEYQATSNDEIILRALANALISKDEAEIKIRKSFFGGSDG